jgi:hypothetical protein
MAADSGNNSIHVGGHLYGAAVAGDHNEVHNASAPAETLSAAEESGPGRQHNTAYDRAAVYAVTDGDMHIYQGTRTDETTDQ